MFQLHAWEARGVSEWIRSCGRGRIARAEDQGVLHLNFIKKSVALYKNDHIHIGQFAKVEAVFKIATMYNVFKN